MQVRLTVLMVDSFVCGLTLNKWSARIFALLSMSGGKSSKILNNLIYCQYIDSPVIFNGRQCALFPNFLLMSSTILISMWILFGH